MPKTIHDYRVQSYSGLTTIHEEAAGGTDEFLKKHLENDVGLSKLINAGAYAVNNLTALHMAAKSYRDRSQKTATLIKYGADPKKLDNTRRSPVFYVANVGDFKLLQKYFATYMRPQHILAARDIDGRGIVHALCFPAIHKNYNNHYEDHKYKADDSELIKSMELILQQAEAAYPNNDMSRKMLTQEDKYGFSPVMYAKHFGYTCFASVFSKHGIDIKEVQIPAQSKALNKDWYGRNEIMRCIYIKEFYEDKDYVKKLLDNPANNPAIIDTQFAGGNALLFAFTNSVTATTTTPGVQAILEDDRSDIQSVDANNKTILHWFVAGCAGWEYYDDEYFHSLVNYLKVTKLLKKMINAKDDQGNTPLHAFVISFYEYFGKDSKAIANRVAFLDFLISNGANLYARNDLGYTPAAFASYIGKPAVAQILEDRMKMQSSSGCLSLYNIARSMFNCCFNTTSVVTPRYEQQPQEELTRPLKKLTY